MILCIYFLIGITSITVNAQSSNVAFCGPLVAEHNNVLEGNLVKLQINTSPEQQIKWQKERQSTYENIKKNDVYDYTSNALGTSHVLYIHGQSGRYTDSGNYRVACSNAFSNVVYVKIEPLSPSTPQFTFIQDTNDCKQCLIGQTDKELLVSCYTDGGSEPVEFNLYKNGERLEGFNISKQTLGAIQRRSIAYVFKPVIGDVDAVFKCTVKNPATQVTLSAETTLFIFKPPTRIEVAAFTVRENQSIEIKCQTHGGRPQLQPTFLFGSTWTNASQMNVTSTGRTFTVLSSCTRSFRRIENNMTVSCCVNILGNPYCSEMQRATVLFPPVEINVREERKYNKDNGDTQLTLKCSVGASNPGVKVDWQGVQDIPGKTLEEVMTADRQTSSSTLSVIMHLNLTKEDNGREITCSAVNDEFPDMGVLSTSYKANITYSPIVYVRGSSIRKIYVGDDVELNCDVDGNPVPRLVWFNETSIIKETIGMDITLLLRNISKKDSPTYSCVASNNIGCLQARNVTIIVEATTLEKTLFGVVIGEGVTCLCLIAAIFYLVVKIRGKNQNQDKQQVHHTESDRNQSVYTDLRSQQVLYTNSETNYAGLVNADSQANPTNENA